MPVVISRGLTPPKDYSSLVGDYHAGVEQTQTQLPLLLSPVRVPFTNIF